MKNILSLKFKLWLNKEQKRQLISTAKKYNEAVNYVLEDNFVKKSVSMRFLHNKYYHYIRENYGLSSQMAINVYREVIHIYQLFKRQSSRDNSPKKKQLTICYTLNRNITVNTKYLYTSFALDFGNLKKIKFTGWEKHYDRLRDSKLCDSKIKYESSNKTFYLIVPVQTEGPEVINKTIAGVDVGERNVAVIYDTNHKIQFYKTPEYIKRIKRQYQFIRSSIQSKGTRSAKRKFIKFSRKEKRFTADFLHGISKNIIFSNSTSKLVMENLTHIRKSRKVFRKGNDEKRQAGNWAFRQLQFKIDYKSKLYNGIESVYIDPAYTSQSCPVCGFVSKGNRNKEGFCCLKCGYKNHADVVGAMNIANRFIINEQNLNSMQVVNLLNVLGAELQ